MEYEIDSLDDANEAAIDDEHYLLIMPNGGPAKSVYYWADSEAGTWMWGQRASQGTSKQDEATAEEVRWAISEALDREDRRVVARNFENTMLATTIPRDIDRDRLRRRCAD
jgi:hypothetical protein